MCSPKKPRHLAGLVGVLPPERVGNVADGLSTAVALAQLRGDALVHGAEVIARPLRLVHDHIITVHDRS